MSWSVQAIGKAGAVGMEIAKQFDLGGKCAEPEETIRQSARVLVMAAIGAQDKSKAVKVTASGSQSTDHATKAVSNVLNISVEPLWNFVE